MNCDNGDRLVQYWYMKFIGLYSEIASLSMIPISL